MSTPINQQYLSDYITFPSGVFIINPPRFIMPPVPNGSVWTVTFSVAVTSTIKAGINNLDSARLIVPHADLLSNIVWTLYRNNSAEQSWTGLSQLCNVQLFGNDQITIVGSTTNALFPASLANSTNPVSLTLTTIGYSSSSSEAVLTVPFISTSASPDLSLGSNFPQSDLLTTSTNVETFTSTTVIPVQVGTPVGGVKLWSGSLSISATAATTNDVMIQLLDSGAPRIYLTTGVVASSTGNSVSVCHDLRGIAITNVNLPLKAVVTNITGGTVDRLVACTNLQYTVESLV